MNFVDAAVVLLKEANAPVHVEELCRLALERGLLDSPGSAPLRSFKGRLTTELKRGADSRVVRVEDDLWALSDVASTAGPDTASVSDSAHDHEHAHDHDHDHALVDDDEDDLDEDDGEDEDEDDFDDDEDDGEDEASAAVEPKGEAEGEVEGEGEGEGEAEPAAPVEERVLTAEEQALAEVYGDEMDAAPVGALVEYRDAQTADEDRPMTPEMTGERRSRRGHGGAPREDWKARRERMREERRLRREEREKRQAGNRGAQQGQAPAGAASQGAPATAAASATALSATAIDVESLPAAPSSGGDLARRACEVLASIKGGQPVPVKQLAQMMRKRRLIEDDPEKAWRPLKAALLADNQRRAAAGLPPRIQYRGRDLFSYRPSGNAELEAVELAIETATQRLRGATERALAARLADLQLGPLEQVAHLYLTQVGWRDIDWIKRVDRSGYATALEPGEGVEVLVSVRAGNQEIDRRGVGELRAGVAAKGLARGLLLAPRELGADARSELERDGAAITVMAGLGWAAALAQAGVGVAQRMVPVTYLDGELLDRLAE